MSYTSDKSLTFKIASIQAWNTQLLHLTFLYYRLMPPTSTNHNIYMSKHSSSIVYTSHMYTFLVVHIHDCTHVHNPSHMYTRVNVHHNKAFQNTQILNLNVLMYTCDIWSAITILNYHIYYILRVSVHICFYVRNLSLSMITICTYIPWQNDQVLVDDEIGVHMDIKKGGHTN